MLKNTTIGSILKNGKPPVVLGLTKNRNYDKIIMEDITIMNIKITPVATLQKYFKSGYYLEIEKGLSIRDLLLSYDVPLKMIMFITVNKQTRDLDYILQEDDNLIIYPFISGG